MAKICVGCSKEYPDSQAFCTECGNKLTGKVQPETVPPTVNETPIQAERQAPPQTNYTPQQQQTVYAPPAAPQANENLRVSTGYYFGMMFVYALPVLGWLICLITSFAGSNPNKKSFARAILIWTILGIVLGVGLYFLFSWLGGMLMDYINSLGGTEFGSFGELEGFIEQFENGGMTLPTE